MVYRGLPLVLDFGFANLVEKRNQDGMGLSEIYLKINGYDDSEIVNFKRDFSYGNVGFSESIKNILGLTKNQCRIVKSLIDNDFDEAKTLIISESTT